MAKKLTDLTGDGKVTQADVLKGRGVFKKGGMTKKGYAKGGKITVRGTGAATKGLFARGPMG
jgi:hypothetical protein|tara:strand:+ start:1340 stop:1525 length:186 start_codon:yes stop_codon:yes gene_type:complete